MKKPAPSAARTAANAPHEVRIIGGLWKRTRLPVADRPGLRPTPSRVRETLFNWLGQDLSGWRCIDAFAGTGALGLEAASRGAVDVTLVEQDSALLGNLGRVVTQLKAQGVRVERGDGVAALRQRSGQGLDVVFLDPPFGDGQNETLYLAALAAARQAVREDGLIYLEAPRVWGEDELAQMGLQIHRQGRAGAVAFHLLRPLSAQ
ncbi:16S rRNA (guanine(966)-N(2))-methyltransferase RsmD [Hydrogenophaga laconesensis]|uniref:16S rRNA (Guanine(966)-N(2))-methyltransferase RsmD n=1 Tax=Hydrogenophaga laconesensis TaxID=1805971 RepID=A0ABU1VCD8_9BURK|nr:16S rRNA (guanine(966)-N(2))-methyltransferase RsmD [Hydrogenophaga laconesensis]MDR7095132.1 16S rRNA (guanine(966)-N(2))-methyltransferase RsmD [Hydrogenophaga laconesensis]